MNRCQAKQLKVSVVLGTRPEAIKLAPVVLAMRAEGLPAHVCSTGQHREMLEQVLSVFGIVPDVELDLMKPNQTLSAFTSTALMAMDGYLERHRPDLLLVQGDTATTFSAALAAFYRGTPVAHVEAGLRTWRKDAPYPEEMNRVLTTKLADYHFAPTESSAQNLQKDGVEASRIVVTGNTVIDALLFAVERARGRSMRIEGLPLGLLGRSDRRIVLVTGHRRESFGAGFESICRAIAALAARFREVDFVYPVHLNPKVREPVYRVLTGAPNVFLVEPLEYLEFVALMDRSALILTDSGGIQEEAPTLGKPVLVMRETTERSEAIEAGTARLVGTDTDRIVESVGKLLTDPIEYQRMASISNPFGDGHASRRIVRHCADLLAAMSSEAG